MKRYFVDLHVHIGRTHKGKPVKITAARNMTLTSILQSARFPKGLDMVGVIDCHSPEVLEEMEQLLERGSLLEMPGGGLRYEGDVTLIPGCEMEVQDEHCQGPIHVLAYFPDMLAIKEFSSWLSQRVTNVQLSTQRMYEQAHVLQRKVKSLEGIFIPAHVFTPFKSLYGKGVMRSMEEILLPELIDAVELGLSSNTEMADRLCELHSFTFVSNSDAHSLPKMAREYQSMQLEEPDFQALRKALRNKGGNRIEANYGLNPYLGKYYTTTCSICMKPADGKVCSNCGCAKLTKGVSERIQELSSECNVPPERPPYIHQVPLEFLPGLGAKTMEKLYNHFGSEMNILHDVSKEALSKVVNTELAALIIKARDGDLKIEKGGGGKYGRVSAQQDKRPGSC